MDRQIQNNIIYIVCIQTILTHTVDTEYDGCSKVNIYNTHNIYEATGLDAT